MLIVFPYSLVDQEQAIRLARWIAELGGCERHSVLVVRDHRTTSEASEVLQNVGFEDWQEIIIRDDAYNKWPESPNLMFRRAAKHIEYGRREPWLWLEADAAPLVTGWMDAIQDEYKAANKPFLGDFVNLNEPGFKSHCSGVAVYPGVMSHHAGNALMAHETAWDVVGASQIIPQMHKSKLILHLWKHPTFENWEQVEQRVFGVKPEAVLFHASKDGSLIQLLRQQKNLSVPVLDEKALLTPRVDKAGDQARGSTTQPEASLRTIQAGVSPSLDPRDGQFTFDILIKSYPPDYERLRYCLRSIEKFADGIRRVVLVLPKSPETFRWRSWPGVRIIEVEEAGEGYLFQQTIKAQAHQYTDADYILHIDSDCIFTEPVTPETFMRNGKPIWYKTPYSAGLEVPWEAITEKFMQAPVEYEFMRRFPFLVPRFLHEAIAEFCQETHGQLLTDYILSQPIRAFSEFNALGALAHAKFQDKFHWIDTTKEELPEPVLIQKWSHAPFTDAEKAEFEDILKDEPLLTAIKQTKEGMWVLVNDSHISKWVEEKGQLQHDYHTLPLVLEEIPVGGIVVDAGAFIGDTAGPFLNRVGPTGTVYAFEPHQDAFTCLVRNCPGVIGHRVALSNKAASYPFELSDNAGASHVSEQAGETIRAITLDSFQLERLDFFKIDVEGFEFHALQGAEQTIDRSHPKLLIEINEGALQRQGTSAEEISDWLFKHGYKWRPIQPNITAGSPQYDILCTHIKTEQNSESASTVTSSVVDWSKFEEDASTTTIRTLAEQLKGFMGNSVETRRVRNVLHEVGVIELPYRYKRRRGWKRKAKAKAI